MLTDDGFLFFINVVPTTEYINYVKLGTKKEDIVNLNPLRPSTDIQSSEYETYPVQTGNYKTTEARTSTIQIQTYHSSFRVQHTILLGSTYENAHEVTNYYELGIFSNTGKLLIVEPITNVSKTFLVPKTKGADSYYTYNINMLIPFKTKTVTQTIRNKGVDTNYKIKITLQASLGVDVSSKNIIKGLVLNTIFKDPDGSSVRGITPEINLESYDLATKKATYNIVMSLDSNHANKPRYKISLETSFGTFYISFHDAITEEDVGFPLVDVGSLVIPLTLNLGDML